MAARKIDAEIDRLYQLVPDEFTAARNALAKSAGADAAAIKQLTKPPIAAWAVNQVYWQHRDVYDALVAAAKELRQTHKTILGGRTGDLRSAGKAHEAAVDQALKTALSLLAAHGHPATDTTRQAIATTLRALPSADPPGRLTATLQPGGFEMLAGLSIGSAPGGRTPTKVPVATKETAPARSTAAAGRSQAGAAPFHRKTTHTPPKAPDPKAAAQAREAAARAARELREAEHTARREEFESARATREAEKATRQLQQAREALAAAQREVEEAEAAAAEAERTKAAAEQRAEAAERALEEAKRKAAG
jgi:flagellar biosynthesis GTPase FlhF